jgi:hypothetical protein
VIVTAEELKAYMSGARLPTAAEQIIPGMIDGTQGELEAWLGYSIEVDQPFVTETISVDRNGRLLVTRWPVAEVKTVTTGDGGVAVFTFTGDGEFYIPGQIFDATGYTVMYRPGLPPRPFASAKLAILRVVTREATLMHDDSRERDGDTKGRKRTPPVIGWQKGEKRPFSRWRRRTIYSRPQVYGPDVGPSYGTEYGAGGTEIGGVLTANPGFLTDGDATVRESGY